MWKDNTPSLNVHAVSSNGSRTPPCGFVMCFGGGVLKFISKVVVSMGFTRVSFSHRRHHEEHPIKGSVGHPRKRGVSATQENACGNGLRARVSCLMTYRGSVLFLLWIAGSVDIARIRAWALEVRV